MTSSALRTAASPGISTAVHLTSSLIACITPRVKLENRVFYVAGSWRTAKRYLSSVHALRKVERDKKNRIHTR